MYEVEKHNFGEALEAIKAGKKARRIGWNGKNQHIEVVTNIVFDTLDNATIKPKHETMGNNAIAFFGTIGIQVGWLASQADMLSEDWIIYE